MNKGIVISSSRGLIRHLARRREHAISRFEPLNYYGEVAMARADLLTDLVRFGTPGDRGFRII